MLSLNYHENLDAFILRMLELGPYIDMALVGNFSDKGIGSRRDIELAWHRDGIYSEELSNQQGGVYLERPGIKYVGLYCIRETEPQTCLTLLRDKDGLLSKIDLRQNCGLIFDNTLYEHSREGKVGNRLLARMWIG